MRERLLQALGSSAADALARPMSGELDLLANDTELPSSALVSCTLRPDESAPAILAVLTKAADGADLDFGETQLLIRGLHVLGAARVQAAWAPLSRMLRRPAAAVDALVGDAIAHALPRIVAGTFDGDSTSLFAIIADPEVDELVRYTMFETAAFLTWDGRIDQQIFREFLLRFDAERLAEDGNMAWDGWAEAIGLLGLRDLTPMVREAFKEYRVFSGLMDVEDFEGDLAKAEAAPDDIGPFEALNVGYIENFFDMLDWMLPPDDGDLGDAQGSDDFDADLYRSIAGAASEPVRNPFRDVGRNDPCPCGSGKKAKKCCLATG